jgi:hypothetical protein
VVAVAAIAALGAVSVASAQAAINGTTDANTLGTALSATPPVTGATLDTAPSQTCMGSGPCANAVDNTPLSNFPTNGSTFSIMTSGDAYLADQPNDSPSSGYSWGYQNPVRGEASYDPSTLAIPLTVPSSANCLAFDYKFFSDEFPEFVGSPFNDVFVAELDKTTWTITGGGTVSAPDDFAAHGTQVSINGIGPNAVSPDNSAGTTYDAASALLSTKTAVAPGSTHTLYLSISDASDAIYDSAVFLDNLHFTNEPPTACHPPDIFQGQVGAAPVGTKFKVKNNSTFTVPILCGLPIQATTTCEDNLVATGNLGRLAVTSATKALTNTAHASIAPTATVSVKLKLKKKARKKLAKKGKLKAKLVTTNTFNGAQSVTKVTLKGKKKHRRHH